MAIKTNEYYSRSNYQDGDVLYADDLNQMEAGMSPRCDELYSGSISSGNAVSIDGGYGAYSSYIFSGVQSSTYDIITTISVPAALIGDADTAFSFGTSSTYVIFSARRNGTTLIITPQRATSGAKISKIYGVR